MLADKVLHFAFVLRSVDPSNRLWVYGAVDGFNFGDEELLVRVELYLVFGLEGELAVGLSFGKRQDFCL